jgi:hypothetical protein
VGLVKWLKAVRQKRKDRYEEEKKEWRRARDAKTAYKITYRDVDTGEFFSVLLPYNTVYDIECDRDKHLIGVELIMTEAEINPDYFFKYYKLEDL